MKHGTSATYSNHGCRCEPCTEANTERQRRWRAGRRGVEIPPRVHGSTNGYKNYNCRCEPCAEAAREYRRAVRLRAAIT